MRHSIGTIFRAPIDEAVWAPVIHTARLTLRPYRMSDAQFWLKIERDPFVRTSLGWPVRDREQALEHLKDRTQHNRLARVDDFLVLAMELDGVVIGDVSMHLRDASVEWRCVEMGWLQLSEYGGHGYATEAVEALLNFALEAVHARWASATIHADNRRSIELAQRLGFRETSTHEGRVTFMRSSVLSSV